MQSKLSLFRRWTALLALLSATLVLATPVQADPAGRIGRIAWLSGTVNLYNPSTGESFSVPLNQPLTSGDILTAAANSRAEIQIGAMTVRLDSGSELELAQIDDQQVHLVLKNGRLIAKLPLRESLNDFTLDTPDGRFNARDTGVYRFDADASSSSATTYYGALHFASSDSALDIDAGQSAQFWYEGGQTRSRLSNAINDSFTQWSAGRDRRPPANTYARYVSPEMTGAEDLDAYGNWSTTPEFGVIWFPRNLDRDWAPYRTGHWVWVSPWGWNWVGNEPWGFAPFHYGRWVQERGAWGWVPGARVVRPVYSPAMVAWIGAPGVGVSISIGAAPSVGWFPLAPHEVYVPSYRSSENYVRNVNITHVTNITNVTNIVNNPQDVVRQAHYANRSLPQAITVVPSDVVTQRRPVAAAMLSPRDTRALREQAVQVAAPVAAPMVDPRAEARGRQDHSGQPFARRDNQQQDQHPLPGAQRNRDVNPSAPAPALQAPSVAAQRTDRPLPEAQRLLAQPRPDPANAPAGSRNREATPPPLAAPAPQAATDVPQRGDRHLPPDVQRPMSAPRSEPLAPAPQRTERPTPEMQRPVPSPRAEPAQVPAAPRMREVSPPPPVPAPQVVVPQRVERPMPEVQRPAPQARPEPPQAPRVREVSPPPPAPPAPREVSRPAEPRPEAKPQRQEDHPRPTEEELKRRRDAGEKRGNP